MWGTYADMEAGQGFASSQVTSLGYSPALLGILAYIFMALGGLVVMVLEKKNIFVIFHGWQSLVSGLLVLAFQLLLYWNYELQLVIWVVYPLFSLGMIWKVMKDAPSQRLFKLPLIGNWCEHRAFNKVQYHSSSVQYYRL